LVGDRGAASADPGFLVGERGSAAPARPRSAARDEVRVLGELAERVRVGPRGRGLGDGVGELGVAGVEGGDGADQERGAAHGAVELGAGGDEGGDEGVELGLLGAVQVPGGAELVGGGLDGRDELGGDGGGRQRGDEALDDGEQSLGLLDAAAQVLRDDAVAQPAEV
ncbi:MAG: hypothetical protein ACK56I_30880, partial [bacterium]